MSSLGEVIPINRGKSPWLECERCGTVWLTTKVTVSKVTLEVEGYAWPLLCDECGTTRYP